MANFEIVFKKSVEKDLRAISNHDVARIMACIKLLADNPYPPGSRKLSGQKYFRVRLGVYRILYEVEDKQLIVIVVKVGHRREVYR